MAALQYFTSLSVTQFWLGIAKIGAVILAAGVVAKLWIKGWRELWRWEDEQKQD